ncbi:hypothetical protein ACFFLS_11920 [Flavobacterium procerum]|uniref:Uncharacterized protein n=1 Tax=Flavobacterium procerum TaxID=1455569 RepID=A0ABV6BSY9_9FLAO
MFITETIIRPVDCVVAFAIPLNKSSIRRNQRLNPIADFSKHIVWPLYQIDTINPMKFLKSGRSIGFQIKEEFSYSDLSDFFTSGKKVLILFAHWSNGRVELFDGFHCADDFLNVFPEDGRFIVDLNVCTCKELGETLGISRPNSIIKHSNLNIPSYAGAWCIFYRYFFQLLDEQKLTYLEGLQVSGKEFKNIFK